jgi:hypothetical protein
VVGIIDNRSIDSDTRGPTNYIYEKDNKDNKGQLTRVVFTQKRHMRHITLVDLTDHSI